MEGHVDAGRDAAGGDDVARVDVADVALDADLRMRGELSRYCQCVVAGRLVQQARVAKTSEPVQTLLISVPAAARSRSRRRNRSSPIGAPTLPPGTTSTSGVPSRAHVVSGITRRPCAHVTAARVSATVTEAVGAGRSCGPRAEHLERADEVELLGTVPDRDRDRPHRPVLPAAVPGQRRACGRRTDARMCVFCPCSDPAAAQRWPGDDVR